MIEEEFKERVYNNILMQNPMSFSGLHRKIKGNRNKLKKAIDDLISDGLVQKKSNGRGKEIQLSIVSSDLTSHLNSLKHELQLIEKLIKRQMKVLKGHKYLFKFPVRVKTPPTGSSGWVTGADNVTWKINPRAKRDIQFLTHCINSLFEHSGALTYTESLELMPKSYNKKIREYQKECINLVKTTVSELFRLYPEEKAVIQMFLNFNVRGLNTISVIGQMSKRN